MTKNYPVEQKTGLQWLLFTVLIVVALYALYFAKLGSYPLVDPDEPVYGQVAKEMASGAGWLTPHYNGKMWFDKPPLFYWLSGASASVFGPTEFASRFPSAVLAVAVVLLVYLLASHDFGKRAGLFASIAMATCLQQIILAHSAVTDMTLVFCLTLALYAYRKWFDAAGKGRFGWVALCGAMTGLGMLAKGPVAPVLLGITFIVHLAWTGRIKRLFSLDVALAVIVALCVGLPWYVAMYVLHKDTFVQGFIMANNINRFLKPEHASQTGSWYSIFLNVPVLLVFFFPWSVFLPQAIKRSWNVNNGARLALAWFVVVFGFFSLSKTQLVTYIFPVYPSAAIFIGTFLDFATSKDKAGLGSVRKGLWIACIVSLLVAAGAVISAKAKYPEAASAATILMGIMVFTMIVALAWSLRGKNMKIMPLIIGCGMAVFSMWLVTGVVSPVSSRISSKELARYVPNGPGIKYIEYSLERPSLLFYTGIRPERSYNATMVKRILTGQDKVFVFCKEKDAAQIKIDSAVEWEKRAGLIVFTNASTAKAYSKPQL